MSRAGRRAGRETAGADVDALIALDSELRAAQTAFQNCPGAAQRRLQADRPGQGAEG
ncbi:MAG: hypothetical protein WDN06_01655 [Asticcacaulis sp.]